MSKDEALSKAVDTLQSIDKFYPTLMAKETIQACKEALAQPAREWQGLTLDEIFSITRSSTYFEEAPRAFEKLLREKNT